MSDIKRKLTRQSVLIRRDAAKTGTVVYHLPPAQDDTASTPEPPEVSKLRAKAWLWCTQCFIKFPHVYRTCPNQDIFGLFAKICELSQPPPPLIRQQKSQFYSTYIFKRESYLEFSERLNMALQNLRSLEQTITTSDHKDALLGGVSYHASWQAGESPTPQLMASRFFSEVERIDQEERIRGSSLTLSEIDTRMSRLDKMDSVTNNRPTTTQAPTVTAAAAAADESSSSRRRGLCRDFVATGQCGRRNCSYIHQSTTTGACK